MKQPSFLALLSILFCGCASAENSKALIFQHCMQRPYIAITQPFEAIPKPRQLSGNDVEIAAQILSRDDIRKINPEQFGLDAGGGKNHYVFRAGIFAGVENVTRTIGKDGVLYFSAAILGRAGTAETAFFVVSSVSELTEVQCRMSAAL